MDTLKEVDIQIENFTNNKYHNIEDALKYIEKAIEICQKNNLEDKLQECRYHYAAGLFDKGNWKESLSINLDIDRIIEERGEKYVTKIQNYLSLGRHNFTSGNYEISLEYYLEALEESEKRGDLESTAKIKTNLSEIYKKLKDFDTAKAYIDEILIYEENLSKQILGVIYSNYAEIMADTEKYTTGLEFLDKSDKISKEIKDNIGIAYNYMVRGRIYKGQKNYKKAEESFLKSISVFKNAQEGVYIFEAYEDYVRFLLDTNKLDKAEDVIKESLKILEHRESIKSKLSLEKFLSIINYKKGNYRKAVDHYIVYDRNFGEYDSNILNMRLLGVKTKFDIIKTQKEKKKIERYNKELEEKRDVFEIATEIIKEINSSLKLKEIVSKIHENLKNAIPLDVFGIALYDKENGKLIFKEYVEGDEIHGDKIHPIDVNSKRHFVSYVVRNNEDIHLKTMDEKSKYVDEIVVKPFNRISETVIMKRLIFEGEVLGVLTVQSYKKDIYDSRHISIIDLITPYLAIAINNSIKSTNLLNEIKKRQQVENKLKSTNKILRSQSNTDNLTGLYNRHYLNKKMDNFFRQKNLSEKHINLIMVDIDFFKEYNDTYGHVQGDKAIKKIGNKIQEISLKYRVNAFRYGGDEFLIIDHDLNKKSLDELGKELNIEIENLKIENDKSPISDYITVSVGITQVNLEKSCNQNKLIKKVDNALYESKRVGRNNIIFI